jgi:tRNA(fMet)-specific endonuclease VapC
MYVLDTDHISLIQRNRAPGQRILAKLASFVEVEVVTTIVSYEEQVKGRFAFLSQAKTPQEVISAYQGLQWLAQDYCSVMMLPFDSAAFLEHQQLRKRYPRLDNMDLKIAAIVLTNRATLLTRNRSDFGKIAGLQFEDWS